jgi:hypothetical protein
MVDHIRAMGKRVLVIMPQRSATFRGADMETAQVELAGR